MSTLDALTVTVLGMGAVFIGLVFCIVFIQLFNRITGRIRWEGHGHGSAPAPAPEAVTTEEPGAAPAVVGEPVAAEVLAVIATVIEVERRLYPTRPAARLTIRRSAAGA
ncbi:MAG TPA: OadG family protein [Thermoanaerobaculaceae bacterium]|nr:OadG family protein [Thermoanaerobaculaceae bacterium]HRS14837.1 OadG family protein [Thermoanaerobaculaceae bacterium]